MSSNQSIDTTNVKQATAMPAQTMPSYPLGANSMMTAGPALQQQQAENQTNLAKLGGRRRNHRRSLRGGQNGAAASSANVIVVPTVPVGAPDPAATGGNYAALTNLAEVGASQAVYDTAKTPADTAAIAATNNKGGGWKKKGGSFWGCLSGGKKYRRKTRKSRKTRRSRKTKRRYH